MTALLLIRHGQASFGTGDYDRLCPLGMRQARILGAHLAREGRLPQAVLCGSLRRQAETAAQALDAAGLVRDVITDPAFDEYASDALFRSLLPSVVAADPELTAAGDALRRDRRLFQKALSGVLSLWLDGAPCPAEPWSAFRRRVAEGLAAAVAGRRNDEVVAIFTSGGVIGTAVGEALGLPPERSMALSWRIYNASVTELRYGRSGFSLAGFNAVAHLRLHGGAAALTSR
jgi:broad specificity phosphatase PhoE